MEELPECVVCYDPCKEKAIPCCQGKTFVCKDCFEKWKQRCPICRTFLGNPELNKLIRDTMNQVVALHTDTCLWWKRWVMCSDAFASAISNVLENKAMASAIENCCRQLMSNETVTHYFTTVNYENDVEIQVEKRDIRNGERQYTSIYVCPRISTHCFIGCLRDNSKVVTFRFGKYTGTIHGRPVSANPPIT